MVGYPGQVLAWTVVAAGLAQFLWLVLAAARAGMALRLPRPRMTPGVRRLWALMVPGVLSAAVLQINLLVGTVIATLEEAAVSYLYYADRIYQLAARPDRNCLRHRPAARPLAQAARPAARTPPP